MPPPPPAHPPGDDEADPRRWLVLGVLCVNLVLIVAAVSSTNVALPTLARPDTLNASQTGLQWIVDIYALVFAGLLLPAGALGDRFGRKGALQAGLAIFVLASLAASFSGGTGPLIGARAVAGIGAALIMPTTLSILTNVFPPHERARAIGIWAGFAGAGGAIGPLVGGFVLTHFWWGSVFLINVLIGAVALVAGGILVPTSRDAHRSPLDPVGSALSMLGFGALLFAVIEAPERGWSDPLVVAGFVAALALLGGFVRWEATSRSPMVDVGLFRVRRFATGTLVITMAFFSMFGMFFVTTQYLQYVRGYSPLLAGLGIIPNALAMLFWAPRSARIVTRLGARATVASGLLLHAAGFFLLSLASHDTPYVLTGGALAIIGTGSGLAMAPTTAMIMAAVPRNRAGMGSAVNDTAREVGGAAGIAVLGSILATRYRAGLGGLAERLPGEAGELFRRGVGQALQVSRSVGGPRGADLAGAAQDSFVQAMAVTLRVGSATAAVAALAVLWLLRAERPIPTASPAARPAIPVD
ncbi:MAG TPA: DHA2 family efflux MFS transporter permease subunit [Acidimicrobiales bacterium]|nr:DHA2 family efflux MFS transporter permease subunit [Acidimicrobiales bacterium]